MNDTVNIPDVKERERALDPGQSFIVQAPAGSGKTELLTQRYLRLLTCVNAPEEVVAITFTRKAAAEMRGRILGALHKAQIEPEPDKPHEKLTWRLASAVCQHDKQHGWNIQQNPTRLRIQTIDSLCAAITRQMPILSRFGAQPGIVEDANELYRKAARDTLALLETGQSWSDSVAALLRHLDNNLAEVENLLASMLARRDQWLRHVADRTDPRIQRHILEQALANLVSDELSALPDCWEVYDIAERICSEVFDIKPLLRSGVNLLAVSARSLSR